MNEEYKVMKETEEDFPLQTEYELKYTNFQARATLSRCPLSNRLNCAIGTVARVAVTYDPFRVTGVTAEFILIPSRPKNRRNCDRVIRRV